MTIETAVQTCHAGQYDEVLTPKQKRIIEGDVRTLFSSAAFLGVLNFDELKLLPPFHPQVEYDGASMFLSAKAIAALRRLIGLLGDLAVLSDTVSRREIDSEIRKSYGGWLSKRLTPTGREFVEEVMQSLIQKIKQYEFLVPVEGLDLKDQDILYLGSMRIQRSDRALLENVDFKGFLDTEKLYSEFKETHWLIGSAKGSVDVASEQFENRAVLTVGILAVYGAVLYKTAIRSTRVRALTSPLEHRKAVSSLRWETGGKNPSLSRAWGSEQDLPLNPDSVLYLTSECFLEQLSALPDKRNRSELEDAIVRAVYWFAEAYKDRNFTMQFVKLWSCAECFFSIDKNCITEMNAKGIAAVLTFAGFSLIKPEDYPEFKRRIKKLYELRSKAIHRAEFGHIEAEVIDDLSHWVAWVIISMVALAERGYKTLREVEVQALRLDKVVLGL